MSDVLIEPTPPAEAERAIGADEPEAEAEVAKPAAPPSKRQQFVSYLQRRGWFSAVVALAVFLALLGVALAGAVVFVAYPAVFRWGFGHGSNLVTSVVAVAGFCALLVVFFWAFVPCSWVYAMVVELINQDNERLTKPLRSMDDDHSPLEDLLEQGDSRDLVRVLRYSRQQLNAYYQIGLEQTQASFRYSVLAMWIGFLVLLGAVLLNVLSPDKLFGRPFKSSDVSSISIASGAIIEFISALFLLVYRNSMTQLHYFYERQFHTHGVLLSFQVASTMQLPDDAKQTIVEQILTQMQTHPQVRERGLRPPSRVAKVKKAVGTPVGM